ncbi:MAG: hydrogenase maturation protease [Planctomycetota bacterium]
MSASPATTTIRTLVLGLGNDILADDAIGLLAARALRGSVDRSIDVAETSVHGVALLDLLTGYDHAVLIDAVRTGRHPPGTVLTLDPQKLSTTYAPSPHYAGLPEVLALARALELEFPHRIEIVAVEVADSYTIDEAVTPAVLAAMPEVCRQVRALLTETQLQAAR